MMFDLFYENRLTKHISFNQANYNDIVRSLYINYSRLVKLSVYLNVKHSRIQILIGSIKRNKQLKTKYN